MAAKRTRPHKKRPSRREQQASAPRPGDGLTPPALYKPDTRAHADKALLHRIGPVVPPTQEGDWY